MKYKDISPELKEKTLACKTPEEVLTLAKNAGYKLSDDELRAISGGGFWSDGEGCYDYNSDGCSSHIC